MARNQIENAELNNITDAEAVEEAKNKYFGQYKEVAKFLGISENWLKYYRDNNTMPYHKRIKLKKICERARKKIEKAFRHKKRR